MCGHLDDARNNCSLFFAFFLVPMPLLMLASGQPEVNFAARRWAVMASNAAMVRAWLKLRAWQSAWMQHLESSRLLNSNAERLADASCLAGAHECSHARLC